MKVNKLITDTNPIDQPNGSYLRAYNILLNKAREAVTNEFGFKPLNLLSKKVIYALPVDNDELILWLLDPTSSGPTGSEIARLTRTGNYQTIVRDDKLNFNVKNSIKAVSIRNFKDELVIIYEDYDNSSRIINVDNIYPVLNPDFSFITPGDVELLNIDPHNLNGYLSTRAIRSNGGQLKSGAYYFTTSYEIPDGDRTSWGTIEGPVSIWEDHPEKPFIDIDGADADTPTTKSIELLISNIDTRYEFIKVAVVKKIGGVVTAEEFAKIKITGNSETIVYTGGETVTDLIVSEVITPSGLYKSARTLALIGNTLTRGNLKVNPLKEYNYQPHANNIRIDWVAEDIELDKYEGSYKDPLTILSKRGYFPDEVYAFYARLIFKDGSKSDAFHIPGPDEASRSSIIFPGGQSVRDKISTLLGVDGLQYTTPFQDEATVLSTDHLNDDLKIDKDIRFFQTRETALNRADDNMGVWYNESENYPDNTDSWGALAGTPVRHHKFPSVEVINNYTTVTDEVPSDGELTLSEVTVMPINYSKTEGFAGQYANADGGVMFSVPLSVASSGVIDIQEQSLPGDMSYLHRTSETTNIAVPEQGYYIYRHIDSVGELPLFFIADHVGSRTVRLEYNITWKYDASPNALALGNAANIHLSFINPELDIQLANDFGDRNHYKNDSIINVHSISGLSVDNNQILNTSGVLEITLEDQDLLGFGGQYIHVDNDIVGPDSNVDIDFTFYDVSIKISDAGAPLVPSNKGKVLGIKAENVVIPAEIADDVLGYEILYAKRDSSNMRILGQSLAFGSAQHPLFEEELGSHAGNSPSHIKKEGSNVSVVDPIRDDRIRFHAFDMLKDKPDLKASFIKAQQYFEGTVLNNKQLLITDSVYSPDPESDEGLKRLTDEATMQSHYLVDYSANRQVESTSKILENRRLRAVTKMRYLPSEAVIKEGDKTINNSYSEECVLLDVDHHQPLTNTLAGSEIDTTFGWLPPNEENNYRLPDDTNVMKAKYFLASLYLHRQDIYRSIFEQELVSTGEIHFINSVPGTYSTGNLFGGDTFLNYYGIRLTSAVFYDPDGPTAPKYFSETPFEALKNVFHFPCYSVSNIGLRHSDNSLKDSYFPKVGKEYSQYSEWVRRKADFENSNSLLYNSDYTSVGDLEAVQPYNTELPFFATLPYRVITSKTYLPEDTEFSLRQFLTNDFYEMPKNKGVITNLEGTGSALLIHTEYALFRTATQDRLATNDTEVVLGRGDLFAIDPVELVPSKHGFAGLQDIGAYLLADIGYVFVDQEQAKIFIAGSSIDEITRYGNREHFRTNLKLKLKEQLEALGLEYFNYNTTYEALGVGYNISYDSEFERLIISKRDYEILSPGSLLTDPTDIANATTGLVFQDNKFYYKSGADVLDIRPLEVATYFKERSFTMSYNVTEKSWICMHNYLPDIMVNSRNTLYSFKNQRLYEHNDRSSFGLYYDIAPFSSFADVVFNPSKKDTKSFPAVHWISEVKNSAELSEHNETLTHIGIYNETHNTGLIPLTNLVNTRNVEGTWNFNQIRDSIVNRNLPAMDEDGNFVSGNIDDTQPYYLQRRFIDKYIIVRYLYDNLAQKMLYLYDVSASYIRSRR